MCRARLAMVNLPSYLPLDSVLNSVFDSVSELSLRLILLPLPHVYIEALVPYRINRVLILGRPGQQLPHHFSKPLRRIIHMMWSDW